MALALYGYWRSTAAWRVRLALAFKGLDCTMHPVNLLAGDQRSGDHLARNPQGLVPVLVDDGAVLTQSLAIIEYLEERFPAPALLPADPVQRALVRGAAQIVAADVHPLGNLRVQRWLREQMGQGEAAITAWLHHWMADGLAALEALAVRHGGRCLIGDEPTLADLVLVPQLYNARRFGLPIDSFPHLASVDCFLSEQPWAQAAHPDVQIGSP